LNRLPPTPLLVEKFRLNRYFLRPVSEIGNALYNSQQQGLGTAQGADSSSSSSNSSGSISSKAFLQISSSDISQQKNVNTSGSGTISVPRTNCITELILSNMIREITRKRLWLAVEVLKERALIEWGLELAISSLNIDSYTHYKYDGLKRIEESDQSERNIIVLLFHYYKVEIVTAFDDGDIDHRIKLILYYNNGDNGNRGDDKGRNKDKDKKRGQDVIDTMVFDMISDVFQYLIALLMLDLVRFAPLCCISLPLIYHCSYLMSIVYLWVI
jgi:hypothetical protein